MSDLSRRPSSAADSRAATAAESGAGEFLAPLLRALAESLDVREIFAWISAEARRVVPHDFLMLGILSSDRECARILALSGVVVNPALRRVLEANDTLTWADPVVGGRVRVRLAERWVATLLADVGGFGVGSDLTWQAFRGDRIRDQ